MNNALNEGFNSARIARFITVVLVCASFIYGGSRSLGGLRAEALAAFYNGTEASGINAFNLDRDINHYSGYATNVLTVAERHETGSALPGKLMEQRDILAKSKDEIPRYEVLAEMGRLCRELEVALVSSGQLNDVEKNALYENRANMDSLFVIITREEALYNSVAEGFNRTLSKAPAVFFKITGLVKPLALF